MSLHPHQDWVRHPAMWNRLQKANSCIKDRFFSHYQGSHKQTKLQNCYPHAQGLLPSNVGFPVVGLESMSSCNYRSTISVVFPIMTLTILVHIISPPYLWLNTRSMAWCFDVGLFFLSKEMMKQGNDVELCSRLSYEENCCSSENNGNMLEISQTAGFGGQVKWIFFFLYLVVRTRPNLLNILFLLHYDLKTFFALTVTLGMECMFVLVNGRCKVYMETWKPPF